MSFGERAAKQRTTGNSRAARSTGSRLDRRGAEGVLGVITGAEKVRAGIVGGGRETRLQHSPFSPGNPPRSGPILVGAQASVEPARTSINRFHLARPSTYSAALATGVRRLAPPSGLISGTRWRGCRSALLNRANPPPIYPRAGCAEGERCHRTDPALVERFLPFTAP
jgi:hypothetical protein